MQMKTKLALIAAAALALVACSDNTGEASSDDMLIVKIGHVAPTSGAIVHLGKDNENGARMAIEELNASGMTIGGKPVTFELLVEDDAADLRMGTAAARDRWKRYAQLGAELSNTGFGT